MNEDYHELGIEAFEASVREKIGVIWDGNSSIEDLLKASCVKKYDYNKDIFNIEKSNEVGSRYIINLAKQFFS